MESQHFIGLRKLFVALVTTIVQYDVIKSSWILMRYIGISQIMEPRNLLKPDFETSVTFEPIGMFWCGFHCCAQENELYHFMYVSLSTRRSLFSANPPFKILVDKMNALFNAVFSDFELIIRQVPMFIIRSQSKQFTTVKIYCTLQIFGRT